MTLRAATVEFAQAYGQAMRDPAVAAEKCTTASEEFAGICARHGVDAEVVSGARFGEHELFPGVELMLDGHFAALVQDGEQQLVVDWTARQFDPTAPVPKVTTLREWRSTWRELGAV